MATTNNAALPALLASLKAALEQRNRAETNRIVAVLLDIGAPLGEQWRKIAQLMQVSGELTLALRAIDAFIASAANKPAASYSKVVLLTQAQRLREAHDLLASLPENVPEPGGRAYVLGNTAITMGRIDEGRSYLLEALKHRPGWGPAWLSLSTAVNMSGAVGDQLLAEADVAQRQGPADLARYHYALGKLHADRADPPAAFADYARGAALLRKETPYSREGDARNAEAAMSGFSGDLLDRAREGRALDSSRPIFVTGLPRSGTTLVEQILASHSAVQDGGELNLMPHVAVAAGGNSGEAIERYLAGGGTLDELGGLYLHLVEERFGKARRIVDKSIDASRFLGLIAAALPDAPLIWMRRDPLDCAWSCLRTFFIHGVAWSYDLADIARHFQLEDELLAFWQERLGPRLLVVPYRELVEAPAEWTRRLLAHCGLAEEPGVFTPHRTERAVATASSLQVRRPINREGLGVAAPYAAQLQPFLDAYSAPRSG